MRIGYIKFKDLKIGNHFIFSSEIVFPFSGMKTGVCVKLSPRKYQYVDDGMMCRVGSITAEVFKIVGNPIK